MNGLRAAADGDLGAPDEIQCDIQHSVTHDSAQADEYGRHDSDRVSLQKVSHGL